MTRAPMLLGLSPSFWLLAILVLLMVVFAYVACWEWPRHKRQREMVRRVDWGFDEIDWSWPS